MIIDGKKIASFLGREVKKEVIKLKKKKPLLTVFLIGDSPDQISFVKIKSKIAKKLGIRYKLIHLKTTPNFIIFANKIKDEVNNPEVSGIIIQQPLPAQLSTNSIYNYIPQYKEIEGHRKKFIFYPPIGLSVLTIIKFIFSGKKSTSVFWLILIKIVIFSKKFLRIKKLS